MPQNYAPEFKKKIVRLHEEEGRTYKSITAEYGVSKASISKWCSELREECLTSPQAKEDYDSMKENLRLKCCGQASPCWLHPGPAYAAELCQPNRR